jgi:hypothetical protein
MLVRLRWSLLVFALGLTATTIVVASQLPDTIPGAAEGPLTERPRFHAPFSATATTIVHQRIEGQRIDRTATARFYRHSDGRVRIDYTPVGPAGSMNTVAVVVPNPYAPKERLFLVDDEAKTVTLASYDWYRRFYFGPRGFSLPVGPTQVTTFSTLDVHSGPGSLEELGTRTMQGLTVTGRRLSDSGKLDERWESEELGLVIEGRHTSEGVDIEYFLSNIRRGDPPSTLFVLPADYRYRTDVGWGVAPPGAEHRLLQGK